MHIVITFHKPSQFYITSKNQRPVTSMIWQSGRSEVRRFMVMSTIEVQKKITQPGPAGMAPSYLLYCLVSQSVQLIAILSSMLIVPFSSLLLPCVFISDWHWPCFATVQQRRSNHCLVYQDLQFRWDFLVANHSTQFSPFRPCLCYSALHVFTSICIGDVHKWLANNILKLNDDKTEVILFTS